jgi:drug/metabolite transporter (DMT)-like permease
MTAKRVQIKGYTMILTAASLWGISSTVAQPILKGGISADWLVTMRMLISGILLIALGLWKKGEAVWAIWRDAKSRLPLLIFAILGILGSQYTFFYSIQEGNAATATLLQYLGPAFIMLYVAIRDRRIPAVREFLALFLALFGTFLLVTGGSFQGLQVPTDAVFWGIASAVTLAIYTLQPVKLLERWGSIVVVGWGFIIGGTALTLVNSPFQQEIDFSVSTMISILFIILFGTLLPYYLFIDSLRLIKPAEASIISTAEPFSAVLASILWLKVAFGWGESFGGIFILMAVVILAVKPKENKVKAQIESPSA